MPLKILNVAALVATIVAAAYAAASFHIANGDGEPRRQGANESVLPKVGPYQIEQSSKGSNSPNIISGGNVTLQGQR
jgi:hypothetical protein